MVVMLLDKSRWRPSIDGDMLSIKDRDWKCIGGGSVVSAAPHSVDAPASLDLSHEKFERRAK